MEQISLTAPQRSQPGLVLELKNCEGINFCYLIYPGCGPWLWWPWQTHAVAQPISGTSGVWRQFDFRVWVLNTVLFILTVTLQ